MFTARGAASIVHQLYCMEISAEEIHKTKSPERASLSIEFQRERSLFGRSCKKRGGCLVVEAKNGGRRATKDDVMLWRREDLLTSSHVETGRRVPYDIFGEIFWRLHRHHPKAE